MAQGSYNLGGDEVKEESSWRYPLLILLATLVLCVVVLYLYIGPDVDEFQGNKPRPTISDEEVPISVGDASFSVPANHTVFPRDRREGAREVLTLYASWPRMEGYAPARRDDFIENEADARRLDILITSRRNPFSEAERLEILYLPQVIDENGTPADYGLRRFTFRRGTQTTPASGYSDREMYLGTTTDEETLVLFCYPEDPDAIVPPDCFREYDLTPSVSVKYYFKRTYLPEWQRIDARVRDFVTKLRTS